MKPVTEENFFYWSNVQNAKRVYLLWKDSGRMELLLGMFPFETMSLRCYINDYPDKCSGVLEDGTLILPDEIDANYALICRKMDERIKSENIRKNKNTFRKFIYR